MTDSQVIREVLDGDTDAFRILVDRYKHQVAATVIGMLGHCPEADDVGQETFIRFYKALKRFRGDAAVGTYITRIAINLSLNELKRRKRKFSLFTVNTDEMENVADGTEDTETVTHHYSSDRVNGAIDKLEAKFRAVVVLRLVEGYSTAETARILRLPLGTVLSRLARAQSKIRKILISNSGDNDGQAS